MWRLKIEYGERAWLEARPYTVTLSTRFDTLKTPYAIIHALARIISEEASKAKEGSKADHVAGVIGGKGFERRLIRNIERHGVTVDEPFKIDLGWLSLEYRDGEIKSFKIDREIAEDALSPLGTAGWPRGVPWPALIPMTRVGEVRALMFTYCDTPWLRDMVNARTLIGLGSVDEGLLRKLEELIECHVELASWGLMLRKLKSMEYCAPKPIVFAVAPLILYARNIPYNMLLFIEDPGLHANIETIDAITDILAAMVEKGVALVLRGEAAERIYEDIVARGVQGLKA